MSDWKWRDTNREKMVQTMKERYGENKYSEMARLSGIQHRPETRNFKKGGKLASEAGRLGAMKRWSKYYEQKLNTENNTTD